MRLERREETPLLWSVLAPALAIVVSLLVCALLILAWGGVMVGDAYLLMLKGALGSVFAVTETLARATPLILTGLAAAFAFRAKFWNIGAEGQLYAGAVVTVVLGTGWISLPAPLMMPLLMGAGALAGALMLLGPAFLKVRFGVDEVVTTLLGNFIMLLFVSMMLEGPLKDPMGLGWPQSAPVLDTAAWPKLIAGKRLHAGLLLALALAALVWFVNARTTFGFAVRAVGANPKAAAFAGTPVERVMLQVAMVSGGLAGLAGVGEVAGLKGNLTLDLSPGFGYAGIVVAMLAQLHPLGVVVSALFIAIVFVGADAMSRAVAISSYLANVIVATSLLFMLVAVFLIQYRVRLR
jgi:simple sugar transport system permease protein